MDVWVQIYVGFYLQVGVVPLIDEITDAGALVAYLRGCPEGFSVGSTVFVLQVSLYQVNAVQMISH